MQLSTCNSPRSNTAWPWLKARTVSSGCRCPRSLLIECESDRCIELASMPDTSHCGTETTLLIDLLRSFNQFKSSLAATMLHVRIAGLRVRHGEERLAIKMIRAQPPQQDSQSLYSYSHISTGTAGRSWPIASAYL